MAAATTTGTMDTTAVMRITVITVDIATMAGTATTVATIFIAAAIAMTVTAVGAVGMMTIAGIVGSEVEVTLVPLRERAGERGIACLHTSPAGRRLLAMSFSIALTVRVFHQLLHAREF